ncbi:uncharacterized protein [Mytilus edulis]|uniref:uncharacterized protein n=1 Tax=Mytilus edulis TaxID=6550 RepID=UPI0039EF2EC1
MCEPCSLQNKTERAVYFCRNCIEKYCEPCSFTHKAHKVSRKHDIVTFDDSSQNTIACEPCNYRNTFARPSDFCKECEEYLCKSCTIEHCAQKQNKNHNLQQLKNALNCEPCLVNGKTGTAVKFCLDCEEPEPLCASCADIHIAMKRTRDHRLSADRIHLNRLKPDAQRNPGNQSFCQAQVQKNSKSSEVDMASTTGKQCEPCNHRGMEVSASHYCQDCDERYCENCMQKHAKSRQSKKHDVVDISQEIENCKPCLLIKVITHASHFCKDCAENLCNECTNTHTSQKLTRNHKIIPFQYVDRKCEICESAVATSFCKDCDDPDLLCELCAEDHTSMKQNRGHKVSSDMTAFNSFAMKLR